MDFYSTLPRIIFFIEIIFFNFNLFLNFIFIKDCDLYFFLIYFL
jgi:hypothetical protein